MIKLMLIKSCKDCPRVHPSFYDGDYACIPVKGESSRKCPSEGIPDWCPLIPLPERKPEMDYLATGYNKCLDDILEGLE